MARFDGPVHVGLTVRDRKASADWYQRVLGFEFVRTVETDIAQISVLRHDCGFLVGLYDHERATGDRFDPFRTGLDHLALEVGTEERLQAWIEELEALGVRHSPVRDIGHARFVSLEDPDGIQFELWCSLEALQPAPDAAAELEQS